MVKTVKENLELIFSSYSGIPRGAWNDKKSRDLTMFRRLLSFKPNADSMKADTFPPLIYAGLVKEEGTMFRHEALPKVRLNHSVNYYFG